jgi:hypothetical protein
MKLITAIELKHSKLEFECELDSELKFRCKSEFRSALSFDLSLGLRSGQFILVKQVKTTGDLHGLLEGIAPGNHPGSLFVAIGPATELPLDWTLKSFDQLQI